MARCRGAVLVVYGAMTRDRSGSAARCVRAVRWRRLLPRRGGGAGRHAVRAGTGAARVQLGGDDGRDRRRDAGGARRGLHHLLVPRRRLADLRDAAGLRRRPARQRPLHDAHAPAQDGAQPDALSSASW